MSHEKEILAAHVHKPGLHLALALLVVVISALLASAPAVAVGFGSAGLTRPQTGTGEDDGTLAQQDQEDDDTADSQDGLALPSNKPGGVTFSDELVQHWKVGATITAQTSSVRRVYLTVPVPMDWPEQSVAVVEEEIPSNLVRAEYRVLDNGVKQMVAELVNIDPGESIEVSITFEVTVSQINAPADTSVFLVPERPAKEAKVYLGRSPEINPTNRRIREQVKTLVAELEEAGTATAWQKVESFYEWVRANIKNIDRQPAGSETTFRDLEGPPEDMVNVFVAMCRAHRVPARVVWVEGHVYAEFYLEDTAGEGHWFPAQLSGNRDFGSMSDPRIIQQKGDDIKVPEERARQPYVFEHASAEARRKPKIKFIRQLIQK